MSAAQTFLLAMLVIFTAPFLVWRLLRTDYYAPLVVVQIVGGILLGPGVLGAAFPKLFGAVFTPATIGSLGGIANWAVMMFVWVAGLELDLSQAWNRKGETATTAGLALGVPLVLGAFAGLFVLHLGGVWIGPKGSPIQVVIGIGMACAVTALPILVLFMDRLGILRQPLGQRVLRYASFDDVAIWGVLALILLDWTRVGFQLAFLLGFSLCAFAARRLMRRLSSADRWAASLIWLIACGLAADWSGLHFMVGAFLSGAVLDRDLFDAKALDRFRDVVLLTVMPVFFLSTGLKTSWQAGGLTVFAAAGILLAASVGGKLLGLELAGWILKWKKGESRLIGWLLQTKALIMIIFVNILLDRGVITSQTFTALLLMAVASTMLTTPMAQPLLKRLSAA